MSKSNKPSLRERLQQSVLAREATRQDALEVLEKLAKKFQAKADYHKECAQAWVASLTPNSARHAQSQYDLSNVYGRCAAQAREEAHYFQLRT